MTIIFIGLALYTLGVHGFNLWYVKKEPGCSSYIDEAFFSLFFHFLYFMLSFAGLFVLWIVLFFLGKSSDGVKDTVMLSAALLGVSFIASLFTLKIQKNKNRLLNTVLALIATTILAAGFCLAYPIFKGQYKTSVANHKPLTQEQITEVLTAVSKDNSVVEKDGKVVPAAPQLKACLLKAMANQVALDHRDLNRCLDKLGISRTLKMPDLYEKQLLSLKSP